MAPPEHLEQLISPTVVLRLALLAVALLVGRASGTAAAAPRTPADNSAEAGFARDMLIQHAQAVDMSFIVRARSGSADFTTLSYDVITGQ